MNDSLQRTNPCPKCGSTLIHTLCSDVMENKSLEQISKLEQIDDLLNFPQANPPSRGDLINACVWLRGRVRELEHGLGRSADPSGQQEDERG